MKRSSIQQLKLRTRKLGHWARECPEGTRGQRNDERYDRRAMRSGENSKGFITVAKPTERRPFFLGASWTFVTLDPGESASGIGGVTQPIGVVYVQLVWLGATVSSDSLLWSRMSHLYCQWG